ncbi:glutamate 5-kinase [Aquibacillus rhizosphaerae]|uniref:Glutamate 5-kinase n=1 Tax=Aquibacillus rhizosphaerae TaxID=3051431 RepID=A0ABT7L4R8_9BACI|nr:glutamate 5-kinase [Aquibacillus sp. LR5S19]MDL4839586.1 glutamate 5-kinase [Aquibacillus sp. LR5S19]
MAKKRVVVKIGSSSLTDKYGSLSEKKIKEHATALASLKKKNYEVILISSGAVSAGFSDLGYPTRPVTVAGKQAAAAVGQGLLVQAYTEAFKSFGIVAAQLLITRDVFVNNEQFGNVYSTLTELLKRSVLPIINENDTVAIDELTFGDNDMLSALVSGLVNADFLIMLTDINGLYDENPHANPAAKRYNRLEVISPRILNQASGAGSKFGTGGMKSKIMAAQTALSLGVNVFVGTGFGPDKLLEIMNGNGDGTYIGDKQTHSLRKQKQWIAFHSSISGKVLIDEGAEHAILHEGKSLLPAGIKSVSGNFKVGEVVEVVTDRQIIAKGQVNYSADELNLIKGMGSQKAMIKTERKKPEAIHRNRLVLSLKEDLYE